MSVVVPLVVVSSVTEPVVVALTEVPAPTVFQSIRPPPASVTELLLAVTLSPVLSVAAVSVAEPFAATVAPAILVVSDVTEISPPLAVSVVNVTSVLPRIVCEPPEVAVPMAMEPAFDASASTPPLTSVSSTSDGLPCIDNTPAVATPLVTCSACMTVR